jgi:hypothetical protein
MNSSTLFNPIRIGVSIVLGLLATTLLTLNYWNDKPGDDPATIQQANTALEQFRAHSASNSITQIIAGMKIESMIGQAAAAVTNSSGKAVLDSAGGNWLITLADGRKYLVKANQAPTTDAFAPYIQRAAMARPWNELDKTIDQLTKRNGVILRARAMTYLDRKPETESSLVWDDRFVLAASEYDVCTNRTHIWETIAVAVCAFLLSTCIVWALVVVLPLAWDFLLGLRNAAQRLG